MLLDVLIKSALQNGRVEEAQNKFDLFITGEDAHKLCFKKTLMTIHGW